MSQLDNVYDRMRLDPDAKFRPNPADLTRKDSDIDRTWKRKKKLKIRTTFRFPLVISLFFFILSVIVVILAYVTNFDKSISPNRVLIMIDSPTFIDPGKTVNISLSIENHNPVDITVADIIISHPAGTILPKDSGAPAVKTRSGVKGGISAKGVYNYSYNPVFYGYKGEIKSTQVRLEYHVEGSRSLFTAEAEFEVNIASSSLNVSVKIPDKIISGATIQPRIAIVSNTDKVLKNIIIKASYPENFTLQSSLPKATGFEKNQWRIAKINPRETKNIILTGILSGTKGTERSFGVKVYLLVGTESNSVETLTHSQESFISIEEPFISIDIVLDGNKGDVFLIPPDRKVTGVVEWSNDTDRLIEDLEIELQFSGNGLNESEISSSTGFYSGDYNKLIWNKIQQEKLKLVRQGDRGKFQFRFKTLASGHNIPSEIINKEIGLHLNIRGNTVSESGLNRASLNRLSRKQIKILSDLLVVSKTLHSTSSIRNSGPVPPTVGEETTYALSFLIKNDGNDLEDATVRIPLVQGVTWGEKFLPARENVTYVADEHEILWNIGNIASVGSGSTRQLDVKVNFVPSIQLKRRVAKLTKKGTLTYTDAFTGRSEEIVIEKFTTSIVSEGGSTASGVVVNAEE